METQKNNGMCRCCASEGTFKDVKTSYQWMGEEEVYADMLRECLDITLYSDVTGEVDGGICEVCITQLRNASNFKKQVLHTEEQFKQRLQDKLFKSDIVKLEPSAEIDEESDNDNLSDPDYSGTEFEVPVKEEEDEPKPKKRGAKALKLKASTSRAKKLKAEGGETSKQSEATCQKCYHNFGSMFNLKRHLRTKHGLDSVVTKKKLCEDCGKVFLNADFLSKHLAKGCPQTKANLCVECDLKFVRASDMYEHMRLLHWIGSALQKLRCPLCEEVFKTHEEHDKHLMGVHDVKLNYEEFTFDCEKDLNKWKQDIEETQNVVFTKRSSNAHKDFYYHCYPKKYLGSSRNPITKVCPARIELYRVSDIFFGTYQATHVCDNSEKAVSRIFCPVCSITLNTYEELNNHLSSHGIDVGVERRSFSCFDDFLTWKSNIEKATIPFYTRASNVNSKAGRKVKKTYFQCSKYRKDVNKTCPARITLTWDEETNSYTVLYCSRHIGHDFEQKSKLTKEERTNLAARIKQGESLNDMIKDAKGRFKKYDLYNIIRDFDIDKGAVNYTDANVNEKDMKRVHIEDICTDLRAHAETHLNASDVESPDDMFDKNNEDLTKDSQVAEIDANNELKESKMTTIYVLKMKKNK